MGHISGLTPVFGRFGLVSLHKIVQISGISRTESEKHEKLAVGSVDVAPC